MHRQPIIALCCVLFFSAVSCRADWLQAETDNFLFLGEVDEKVALVVLRDLETYRSAILALTNTVYFPEIRKVRVFGFSKASKVQDIVGRSGVLGVYSSGNDYPIIVTTVGRGTNRTQTVALHEYAHHVLGSLTADYYPRWYNEGFAEFLASIRVDSGIVTVGEPSSEFGSLLRNPKWTDIEIVLNSVTNYPFDSGRSQTKAYRNALFYGVSWLAVHYLQNTPELNAGFSEYISFLNSGADPLVAFERGFGVSSDDFGERLRRYWRANEFPVVRFQMTDSFVVSKVQVNRLTDDEAEISLALMRAMFAATEPDRKRNRAEIRRDIGTLMKKYEAETVLYHALMVLELKESDYDAAVAAGERAVEKAPENALAIQTLADALFHRYYDGGLQNTGDLSRARLLFRSQLEIEPSNPTANDHYPQAILLAQLTPDELSLNAIAFNLGRMRSAVFTATYLDSADILARAGSAETACLLLDKVATWIRAADTEMTDDERSDIRRQGHETEQERFDRIQTSLSGCH